MSHNLEEKNNKTGDTRLTNRMKWKMFLVPADLLNYRICRSSGRLLSIGNSLMNPNKIYEPSVEALRKILRTVMVASKAVVSPCSIVE